MDYEKLHKDTLAGLQRLVFEGKITEEMARSICADFVAESEDERIREELIGHCKDLARMNQDDKVMLSIYEPWLAYLEKQKEPEWCHHKVDLSGCSEEYIKAYYDGWNNCNQQHSQLKAEQQPAEWSEEDDIIIDGIIANLEYLLCNTVLVQSTKENIEARLRWLKRLKSLRPHWKPSEEHIEMLENIMEYLYNERKGWAGFIASLIINLKKLM